MDYDLAGSFVRGIFQAKILEWVAISFSRESSWPRDQTHVSCITGGFFPTDPPGKPLEGPASAVFWMDELNTSELNDTHLFSMSLLGNFGIK